MPLSVEELQKRNEEILRRQELAALEPIDFREFTRVVNEWLLIIDPGVVKFLWACYAANHLKRDAVWVHMIGASGSGKTELLGMLFDLEDIYLIDILTPQTFLSGMPGKNDASLLPNLSGKTMIFKDFTIIMSQNKDARNEIIGQLRGIYDGHLKKPFGNGKVREWKGKVGLITGVTSMVDFTQQGTTALGERFMHYRIITPDPEEAALRAMRNGDVQEDMRKALRNAGYAFRKNLKFDITIDPLPEGIEEEIVHVANFTVSARSVVIRDFGFKKEIIFVPSKEMPTRISQQLKTLAAGCFVVNGGKHLPEDMINVVYKAALDSIPQTNMMVCKQMTLADEQTTKEIATALDYPTDPIRTYLENLSMLGVCKRIRGSDSEEGGSADRWTILKKFGDILKRHKIVVVPEPPAPLSQEEQDKLLAEANEALAISPDEPAQKDLF